MATAERPLAERHRWIAFLDATGHSIRGISKRTGVSTGVIVRLRRSPLYRALVAQHEEEILQHGYDKVLARLLHGAAKNIRFFETVIAGDWDDDVDRMRVRVDAARALLEVQAPRRVQAQTATTHRFVIEDGRKQKLLQDCTEAGISLEDAIREAEARDVTPEP